MPYVGYVARVVIDGTQVVVRKEYPGGLVAEMEVTLPAVLGIQAADQPPRYVAFGKIRQAMKTSTIEDQPVDAARPQWRADCRAHVPTRERRTRRCAPAMRRRLPARSRPCSVDWAFAEGGMAPLTAC